MILLGDGFEEFFICFSKSPEEEAKKQHLPQQYRMKTHEEVEKQWT